MRSQQGYWSGPLTPVLSVCSRVGWVVSRPIGLGRQPVSLRCPCPLDEALARLTSFMVNLPWGQRHSSTVDRGTWALPLHQDPAGDSESEAACTGQNLANPLAHFPWATSYPHCISVWGVITAKRVYCQSPQSRAYTCSLVKPLPMVFPPSLGAARGRRLTVSFPSVEASSLLLQRNAPPGNSLFLPWDLLKLPLSWTSSRRMLSNA